jgi:D-2-hydroxyacid dehydrogenase (NADP+)
MGSMRIERIGVHESVSAVFPPDTLRAELADRIDDADPVSDPHVAIVGDDDLSDCDAVVTFEHRDAFLDAVSWVHSIQAGVDRFPFDAFQAAGVVLTNSTGIHDATVGETVTGYLLSFARRLHRIRDAQRDGEWRPPAWDEPFTLAGERACVVGLGTLGRGIAERLDALFTPDELEGAIGEATFVALAVPLTGETRGLIGADELSSMRDDAYLVNVSRGGVVDQDALVAALQSDDLAGAALDVFRDEPLPEESPLWGMDEVIVSPHCAAFTRDYYRDIADLVETNLARIAADEALHNRVV